MRIVRGLPLACIGVTVDSTPHRYLSDKQDRQDCEVKIIRHVSSIMICGEWSLSLEKFILLNQKNQPDLVSTTLRTPMYSLIQSTPPHMSLSLCMTFTQNAAAQWRIPTNFAAKQVFKSDVAIAVFWQVPKSYTDLDLTLLCILIWRTYSRFVRENKMRALGACFPQPCPYIALPYTFLYRAIHLPIARVNTLPYSYSQYTPLLNRPYTPLCLNNTLPYSAHLWSATVSVQMRSKALRCRAPAPKHGMCMGRRGAWG